MNVGDVIEGSRAAQVQRAAPNGTSYLDQQGHSPNSTLQRTENHEFLGISLNFMPSYSGTETTTSYPKTDAQG